MPCNDVFKLNEQRKGVLVNINGTDENFSILSQSNFNSTYNSNKLIDQSYNQRTDNESSYQIRSISGNEITTEFHKRKNACYDEGFQLNSNKENYRQISDKKSSEPTKSPNRYDYKTQEPSVLCENQKSAEK